ncbi:hypothetical protein IVB30_32365 [Bradyrhizobium sp. 200]|uniref:hypothetical protein n=1 Tax=Bradyrhizobium sp. 200 TaxID=2782665 RepID=UPI001FFFE855|nr:hypothetical protein [Bradyrhizobium sp. 200]UPJ47856.1 hypothetical protein IVB30_32365 [Bradyrhizobium sp. 200]
MHTVTSLRSNMFDIEVIGEPASIADVLPGWHRLDRLGLVIDEPLGGLGATHLVQIAITSFYDASERRRGELTVYPEIYAFHFGRGRGSHAAFDFWPARKEVILSDDPCDLLDAINDRGITRLVIPDRPPTEFTYRPKEADTASDRLQSAFVYSSSGRLAGGDIRITGIDRRTEYNPGRVLRPVHLEKPMNLAKPFKEADSAYVKWLKHRADDITDEERAEAIRRRQAILIDGLASETYGRVKISDALARMASCNRT